MRAPLEDRLRIADLNVEDGDSVTTLKAMLARAFRLGPFDDPAVADRVIRASVGDRAVSRVASIDRRVIGWLYASVHPLAHVFVHWLGVDPDVQGRGVGTALLNDIERIGREAGAACLSISTGDEHPERPFTTIGRRNIWDDPLAAAQEVRTLEQHPLDFYLKLGFVIYGVMPDSNGPGKPEIYLARPIR